MADDVKVKFGGDFTDVAKGAADATSRAGSSLSAWFGDFRKSTEASILSSLALSNIFSNFVKGAAEALQYFREMDLAIKRFGGSGDAQFQQLARYGKEVGVSMETVARTTNYYNKVRAEAAKGNQTYTSILKQFGFTQKEITSGNISAVEVLGRLADAYDKTGYEGIVGERAMNVFGIRGKELSAIFKNGRESLEAFTKSMATMSRESIGKLSETQAAIESFKRDMKETFEGGLGTVMVGREKRKIETFLSASATAAFPRNMFGSYGKTPIGGGTIGQQAASDASMIAGNLGNDIALIKQAARRSKSTLLADESMFPQLKEYRQSLSSSLDAVAQKLEANTTKKPGLDIPLVKELLTSSSLQAIGGGDISSVLSGTVQANMLTAMQETASNTGKLAAGADNAATAQPKPNVAK